MNLKSPNSKRWVQYSAVLISLQVQKFQLFLLLISIILYTDHFFIISITPIKTGFKQNGVNLVV